MYVKSILLAIVATTSLFAVGDQVIIAQETVSFEKFLKHVGIPENKNIQSLYDWSIPGEESAFTWYPERNMWTNGGFTRGGKVYLDNKGKITHRTVGNSIEDGYWEIGLVGNKKEISIISLLPNEISQENPTLEIDPLFIKQKMLCEKTATKKASLFKIKYPNKFFYWLYVESVSTKDGSGSVYEFNFKNRPRCALEDQSLGEKQEHVTKCVNLAGPNQSFKTIYADEAIGACEIAVEVSSENGNAAYSLGRSYKKSGNTDKALQWYRKASDLNSADAKYALGKMLMKGEGVKKNKLLAESLFKSAVEVGSVDAMVWLGVIHVQGINGAKNYPEAERLFRKAISFGNKSAKDNLKLLNRLIKKEKAEVLKAEALKKEKDDIAKVAPTIEKDTLKLEEALDIIKPEFK